VACEQSVFAMPETAIGFFPDVGGTWLLPRLASTPALGLYLALTGARLKGADLVHAGLATHFVSHAALSQVEEALAAAFSSQATSSGTAASSVVATVLAAHAQALPPPVEPALGAQRAMVERIFTLSSTVEAMLAALDAETASEWAQRTAQTLRRQSPSALKLTLRLMREGAGQATLGSCLALEYRATQQCMRGHDFYEGVRALLVDKDLTPRWSPRTLEAVSDAAVDSMLTPPPGMVPWTPQ